MLTIIGDIISWVFSWVMSLIFGPKKSNDERLGKTEQQNADLKQEVADATNAAKASQDAAGMSDSDLNADLARRMRK